MCSKKLEEERKPAPSVYNHPSDDDVEKILSTASYNGEDVTVDGVELTVISYGNNRYSLWTPNGFIIYSKDEDKAKEALKNIKAAIKENEEEEIRFAKKALPTLWKRYKNDEWTDVHEGEVYIDDFFSDYYKDVFGHRPRTASQIEREIKELSRELGVILDETKSCRRGSKRLKEARPRDNKITKRMLDDLWNMYLVMRDMNNEYAYMKWIYVWVDGVEYEAVGDYYDTIEIYEEVKNYFIELYKKYHKYGLYNAPKHVEEYAHMWDKNLGLPPIENENDGLIRY